MKIKLRRTVGSHYVSEFKNKTDLYDWMIRTYPEKLEGLRHNATIDELLDRLPYCEYERID